jgi:tripartite-type tricarboxylate transporter receptor subunit TctC
VAGQVPLFMSNVVIISQHIRAGTLHPLGDTTAEETRHVPGAKSFAEQGFAGFEAPTWWAFLGRAGMPEAILARMEEALRDPAVRGEIEEQGADVVAAGPEGCGRFVAGEIEEWGRGIREHGIRADS